MLTRRTFLSVSAGTLTAALLRHFEWFSENECRPLVEVPSRPSSHIYASRSDFGDGVLTLGKSCGAPEPPSWTGYFEEAWGALKSSRSDRLDLCESYDLEPQNPNSVCDLETWPTNWGRNQNPRARAYDLLDEFDVGSVLRGADGEVGEIAFLDAPFPASDYLGVHAIDDLSISLLQHRLNELGTGIKIHADL
jgi:hypothetical protein